MLEVKHLFMLNNPTVCRAW